MLKRYTLFLNSKRELFDFINANKKVLKAYQYRKYIYYPNAPHKFQYQVKGVINYERDEDDLISFDFLNKNWRQK